MERWCARPERSGSRCPTTRRSSRWSKDWKRAAGSGCTNRRSITPGARKKRKRKRIKNEAENQETGAASGARVTAGEAGKPADQCADAQGAQTALPGEVRRALARHELPMASCPSFLLMRNFRDVYRMGLVALAIGVFGAGSIACAE